MNSIVATNLRVRGTRLFSLSVKNKDLWRSSGFINGKFLPETDNTFDVRDPSNGALLQKLPRMNSQDASHACSVANDAFHKFKKTTGNERSKILRRMADLMLVHSEDLASIITLESGKPMAESRGEVAYAHSFYEWYAEEARRFSGEIMQAPVKGRRMLSIKQPVGPAGLITPWNFPSAMITRKVGPAIAAGCTVVIKPSEETPLSALALCAIAEMANVPPGVINCLTVGRDEVKGVGLAMCHDQFLRKISFTGSTAVGKWLMRESASTVKKVSLELGGNAPFIVFNDADLEVAANALMFAKFRNAGQACIAANRVLVQEGVYKQFCDLMASKVQSALVLGHGLEKTTTMGPLINSAGLDKVSRHVQDCIRLGAKAITGGSHHHAFNAAGGSFFQPTVLTDVTLAMTPMLEESFGPVCPIMSFKTEDEAIRIANDTTAGLAGYAFTQDLSRAFRVSEGLDFGMVGINEGAISSYIAPFGGVKESGLGREGGVVGLEEYLETKYICLGIKETP